MTKKPIVFVFLAVSALTEAFFQGVLIILIYLNDKNPIKTCGVNRRVCATFLKKI